MEQARYWTSTKRKHGFNPLVQSSHNNNPSSYDDSSWEEQAFAEDASGHLGGCIWPPRSYSCSFCRREFRSAQALGGHMNVHRRDRARLKQSSSTVPPDHNEILNPHNHHHHDHHQNLGYNSLRFHYSPQICTGLASNPNPTCDPSNINSPSLKTPQENCCEKTLFPNFSSSSTTLEERKNNKKLSPRSSSSPEESNMVSQLRKEGESSTWRILELGCRSDKVDTVKNSDLSVSLNLVVRRTKPILSDGEEEEEEESTIGCKRRRMEISPCSIEELDLELRLGTGRPKVK